MIQIALSDVPLSSSRVADNITRRRGHERSFSLTTSLLPLVHYCDYVTPTTLKAPSVIVHHRVHHSCCYQPVEHSEPVVDVATAATG